MAVEIDLANTTAKDLIVVMVIVGGLKEELNPTNFFPQSLKNLASK